MYGLPCQPLTAVILKLSLQASVLDRANTSADVLYADRGYPSEKHDALLKAGGYRNRIQRNARIAQVRARVEHAFAGIAHMGGKLIRSIGQARADFAMTMMATCYNLKRFAHLQSVRNVAG